MPFVYLDARIGLAEGMFFTHTHRPRNVILYPRQEGHLLISISKTRLYNILQLFMAVKIIIFRRKIVTFFLFIPKHRSRVHVRTASVRRF